LQLKKTYYNTIVSLDALYRQLSQEKDQMAREIDLEKQKKKRLSCHNEELQWKLKKSTEVANHLAVSTKRLSKSSKLVWTTICLILLDNCFKKCLIPQAKHRKTLQLWERHKTTIRNYAAGRARIRKTGNIMVILLVSSLFWAGPSGASRFFKGVIFMKSFYCSVCYPWSIFLCYLVATKCYRRSTNCTVVSVGIILVVCTFEDLCINEPSSLSDLN